MDLQSSHFLEKAKVQVQRLYITSKSSTKITSNSNMNNILYHKGAISTGLVNPLFYLRYTLYLPSNNINEKIIKTMSISK